MNHYRDRLTDPDFMAQREQRWKEVVESSVMEVARFHDEHRKFLSTLKGSDIIEACRILYFEGDVARFERDYAELQSYLEDWTLRPWTFTLLPFHGEAFWNDYFSAKWQAYTREDSYIAGYLNYDRRALIDRLLFRAYDAHKDFREAGWSAQWAADYHRYFFGERFSPNLHFLGQPASPPDVNLFFAVWTDKLFQSLTGDLLLPNKWSLTVEYWVSLLPHMPKKAFIGREAEYYECLDNLLKLLLGLVNPIDAMKQARPRNQKMLLPSPKELQKQPEWIALTQRLRECLNAPDCPAELARLWAKIQEPGYTPIRKKTKLDRSHNPYLREDVAVIEREPFASFGTSDVGNHFRNAWKAVLGLAAAEIGTFKVSTRIKGEEEPPFNCLVRIVTTRRTYEFEYLVDASEADPRLYDHVAEMATQEKLAGRFVIDRTSRDDAIVVEYRSASTL